MEFQTTLQNGKAYSCTPLHSHLDVKQPFQDFTVKKTHLPELHRTSSVNPAIYIYKKEDKGNISPAWDRGVMSGYSQGGWCGMILQSTASNRGAPIGWRGYRDAALCATSSDQQHVYLSRRLQNSTWKWGKRWFWGTQRQETEDWRLDTGWSRDRTLSARIRSAPWGKSFTSRLDSVGIRSGRRYRYYQYEDKNDGKCMEDPYCYCYDYYFSCVMPRALFIRVCVCVLSDLLVI